MTSENYQQRNSCNLMERFAANVLTFLAHSVFLFNENAKRI